MAAGMIPASELRANMSIYSANAGRRKADSICMSARLMAFSKCQQSPTAAEISSVVVTQLQASALTGEFDLILLGLKLCSNRSPLLYT